MSPAWALLPVLSAPMPFQMAFDEILFRNFTERLPEASASTETPVLRFYYSSEPWVTVGYSHSEEPHEKNSQFPVTKRITGGGRVLHGKDILFSLIARKHHDESFKSVEASYQKIHLAVKIALEQLNLSPAFYGAHETLPKGKDCFLFPIATDLAMGKEKIAGGAQKRSSACLLHQESVKIPKGRRGDEMIQALQMGFRKCFGVTLFSENLNPRWLESAKQLAKEKYQPI